MRTKTRNKKYNPVKRRTTHTRTMLSRYCIAWRDDWEKSHVKTHTGSDVAITRALAEVMTSAALEWDLMICVIGKTQDGEDYVKMELKSTPVAYFNQDLTSVYYENVVRMVSNFNPKHLVASGWILGVKGTLDDVDPTLILV